MSWTSEGKRHGSSGWIGWKMAICLLAWVGGLAPAVAQLPLGTVQGVSVGPDACRQEPLALPGPYTCVEATVRCSGIEDRLVNLRVTRPPAGTAVRGTVVAGMGGGGQGWYEGNPAAAAMLERLNAAGFRVIQRAWGSRPGGGGSSGWISGATGLRDSACRYATLLDWIYHRPQLHEAGAQAFCATGNSGGSSEISYALAVYGMGDLLDLAVPTAGPPHGVVDQGCDLGSPTWIAQCNGLLEDVGICPQQGPNGHTCFYSPSAVALNDSAWQLAGITPCADNLQGELLQHAVLNGTSVVDYPQTGVRFIFGEDDCGSAPPIALPFVSAVLGGSSGPASLRVVVLTGHTVPASVPGAATIEEALASEGGCILRH